MQRILSIAVLGVGLAMTGEAWGQTYAQTQMNTMYRRNSTANFTTGQMRANIMNRTVPQYGFSTANRGIFSQVLNSSPLGKPFTGASGGGSVSPWLALSEPFSSSAHNYYTQVRPQLEQQRMNQMQMARNQQMQRQLNAMAAQSPYSATGSENMSPTGHGAVYMNYGGYYNVQRTPKGGQR
jgi:hypothetical protein